MRTAPFILLVDDDEDDRFLMQLSFRECYPQVNLKTLGTPEELFPFLRSLSNDQYPSLILLDFNMPRLNGGEVLLRLKQSNLFSHIPVVVYSTGMNLLRQEQLTALGATATFMKPYDPEEQVKFIGEIMKLATGSRVGSVH